jgi:guanylate kinase
LTAQEFDPFESVLRPHLAGEYSGLLFVLSGPSGVGKDTIIERLKLENLGIHFAVTMTTRGIRPGEVNGVNYHFVAPEQFAQLKRDGGLLESAVVHGNHYGTPLDEVRRALARNIDVFLKIDVQGAAKVKQRAADAVFIFLAPPSMAELVLRLQQRGTESPDEQSRRLRDAGEEMRRLPEFDYVVINQEGRVAEAVERIKCIVHAEKARVHQRHLIL